MADQWLLYETVDCIVEGGEVIHKIKELLGWEGPCLPRVKVFEDPWKPKTPPQIMPSKDEVTHLAVWVAGLTFHHEAQEDLFWMKMIALKSSKKMDRTICLSSKLRKTIFGQYLTKVNLGEWREVIALPFGPAVFTGYAV
jgi:hypothetical protein